MVAINSRCQSSVLNDGRNQFKVSEQCAKWCVLYFYYAKLWHKQKVNTIVCDIWFTCRLILIGFDLFSLNVWLIRIGFDLFSLNVWLIIIGFDLFSYNSLLSLIGFDLFSLNVWLILIAFSLFLFDFGSLSLCSASLWLTLSSQKQCVKIYEGTVSCSSPQLRYT